MPSYPEGGLRLPLKDSPRLFLSMLTVAAAFYGTPNQQEAQTLSKPGHSTETSLAQPRHATKLGKLTTQSNYYEWQHLRPIATTTTTTQPETDATSTNTPDWRCIKQAEGSNTNGNYTQTSGAFGFKTSSWRDLERMGFNGATGYSVPGAAPPAVQDEAALFLLAYNHYIFKGPWNDYCTEEGIVH